MGTWRSSHAGGNCNVGSGAEARNIRRSCHAKTTRVLALTLMRAERAILCLLFVTPLGRLAAQRAGSRDAGDGLADARHAVAALEHTRMLHLPRGAGQPGAARPCPTRIGGMCHWPEDENAPPPPIADPAVAVARERALSLVASASREVPGNRWLEGQRVALAVASGRKAQAIAAARNCTSSAA